MKKALLLIIGTFSLLLGVIGIILPLLPTTPFLLLSLWCYIRSSEKLYNFVLENKYLSPFIKDYIAGNGISLSAKRKAIFMIWLTIGLSVLFIVDQIFLRLMLLIIAATVSLYIYTRKTLETNSID